MTNEKKISYIEKIILSLYLAGEKNIDIFATTYPAIVFLKEYKDILENKLDN